MSIGNSSGLSTQSLPNNVFGVILAGGSGTRFWPRSRQARPKQLCNIGDQEQSMLEVTLGRLEGLIPPDRRSIITHIMQSDATKKIVAGRCPYVIAEPEARNTAAALALAALHIDSQNKNSDKPAIMVSLHADHVITDMTSFHNTLHKATALAMEEKLVLLGVVPTCPETGYGYIEKGKPLTNALGYQVNSFREKPESKTASDYLKSGNFLWNSGMFVWRCDTIIAEMDRFLPEVINPLRSWFEEYGQDLSNSATNLSKVYSSLPKVAIDNAILEKSDLCAVIPTDAGWQDVGSWSALDLCFESDENGNLHYGDVKTFDCSGTTVDSKGPFVAALGLKDMIVVAEDDCVMVCPKSKAQDVKEIVKYLQSKKRAELL